DPARTAGEEHADERARQAARLDDRTSTHPHCCASSATAHDRRPRPTPQGAQLMPKLSSLLDQIDHGTIALPEFQRGYVWNRDQVRALMTSLYRRYPVGGLLVWQTSADATQLRNDQAPFANVVDLLLDGQQRITSLYGLVRGTPPPFFQGNARSFQDLRFHLEEEIFEFHQPIKMQDDELWVD